MANVATREFAGLARRRAEFGERLPGVDYRLRRGAYAVVSRLDGRLAVVETPEGIFLPGGGQLPGEEPAAAALREAREECGLAIDLGPLLGTADQWAWSVKETSHFQKRCTFYAATVSDAALAEAGAGEDDHLLRWHGPREALAALSHASQSWAVERWLAALNDHDFVVMYRPTGPHELELVAASGYRRWPPRLPEQPIFYPVTNRAYAEKIARDWNVPASGSGYVTSFRVRTTFALRYPIHQVGGAEHTEWWIPAEDLEELNDNLIGPIEVLASY